jgi:hypothetical protein
MTNGSSVLDIDSRRLLWFLNTTMKSSFREPTHFVGLRNLHVHPANEKMQIPRYARNDDVPSRNHLTEKCSKRPSSNQIVGLLLTLAISILPSRAGAEPPPVEQLLDQVGKRVELFWQQFPRVACTETVTQFKMDQRKRIVLQNKSIYDYLIVLGIEGDQITVDESRSRKAINADKAPTAPLLVSKGFSTMLLIFHPEFQPDFEFTVLPDDQLDGKPMHRVAFTHIAGLPTPSVLQLHDTTYPLEWKGVAWVDPDTWSIVKLQTGLKTSMEDIGLKSLESEVLYRPVSYADAGETFWLPDSATVEAQSLKQHWRNVHRFTAFRRFSVESKIDVGMPSEGSK